MQRPLTLIASTAPAAPAAPPARPRPARVPEGAEAQARTTHQRMARIVATLSGGHSTDVALTRARAEAFELGAEMMRLGRRL